MAARPLGGGRVRHIHFKGRLMNTRTSIALAVIGGFALGAVTLEGLHAQAKPPVFVVAEIDVKNAEAYAKEYAPKAQAIIKAKGGRFLAASNNVTVIEGAGAKRLVIQQWDSMEKVKAWRDSPEYKEVRKIGEKYAKFRTLAAEGLPQP